MNLEAHPNFQNAGGKEGGIREHRLRAKHINIYILYKYLSISNWQIPDQETLSHGSDKAATPHNLPNQVPLARQ